MSRYCLDTSAYSQFRRGHEEVVALLRAADHVAVPVIVAGELWAGFRFGTKFEKNAAELEEFLGRPVVHLIEVNLAIARLYGEIYVALRKAGTPVPTNDMWVAASAIHSGTSVVTFDSDFGVIRQVGAVILQP